MAAVVALAAVLTVARLGDASPAPLVAGSPTAAQQLSVVALGDSVPSGARCGCSPFPQVYGTLLAQRERARVTVHDLGVDGEDTSGLLQQLRTAAVRSQVAAADVVTVTIGANDFGDVRDDVVDGSCWAGGADCVGPELADLRTNLVQILALVEHDRAGRVTTLLVTGYWNVFQDGAVGLAAYGLDGLRDTQQLTRRVDAVIAADARAAGATYVDLYVPFLGRGAGVSDLLAADGDHPSSAGHRLIAELLLRAGRPVAR